MSESETGAQFAEMLPVFMAELPAGVDFNSDIWDLLVWVRRKGNRKSSNVIFEQYQNVELKLLVKIFILYKRETKKIDRGFAEALTRSLVVLDHILGPARSALKLTNEDFIEAQSWVERNHLKGAPARISNSLQAFGYWLSEFFGFRITYKSSLKSHYYHGRKANQTDRDQKLIPTDILRDLVAAVSRDDLILKDRFFLSALVLNIACGFRINELTTMPVDCLIEEEGQTGVRYYPEKSGKLGVRWIPSSIVPTVTKVIEFITELTESGRELVRAVSKDGDSYRWRDILADKEASRYFIAMMAHNWTSKPENNLFNLSGAWYEKKKTYIDVLGELSSNNGNRSAVSRKLGIDRNTLYSMELQQLAVNAGKLPPSKKSNAERTSWDTDSRVISMDRVIKKIGIQLKEDKRSWLRDIIENAQNCQLTGNSYPRPKLRLDLDSEYILKDYVPLIVDKDGKPILEAKDALFVLKKYSLSSARGTKSDEISYVCDNQFARWLSGEKRSLGTKNNEDSCFSRLGIIDPRSDEVATFDWHDIRHWLNTMYQKGGLSEDQIALIFGRKASSNHIYDQTDMDTRISRLKESVRKGQVFGHMASTYSRLAEHSRDDAERYLAARTIMVNPMPHGLCSNNWSAAPCPHHLGCFAGNHEQSNGVCEHLEVEPDDFESIKEIERINREAAIAKIVIPAESPQHTHFIRVEQNTNDLLGALIQSKESIE